MLLDRFHTLPDGLRVRLRLSHSSDRRGIRELLDRAGLQAEAEPLRLVRFDPRRRVVVCATALLEGRETVVGVGSIELGSAAPDFLICDERAAGTAELLTRALVVRADRVRSPAGPVRARAA